jgi:predicted DNA-binding ribbon-helix-helix protein
MAKEGPILRGWTIFIAGHKTSVSLEAPFWNALNEIARMRGVPLSDLVAGIDCNREHGNLSSALRLYILAFYRDAVAREVGRQNADHSVREVAA